MSDSFDPIGGIDCYLYYNSGTHASPTWVLIKRAKDVSVPMAKSRADVSRRESGSKMERGAQMEWALEFGYQYRKGTDTVYTALMASYTGRTAIEFAAMDGPIATVGSRGPRFFGEVMEAGQDQPLSDGVVLNFVVAHCPVEESSTLITPDVYTVPSP